MSRLSAEQASEMLAQIAVTSTGPSSLAEASQRAAQLMMSEYKELVATLPLGWERKVFSWLRLNGPSGDSAITTGNIWLLGQWMKTALLACIDGNAGLTPEIVTKESVADLALLRKDVAFSNLFPQEAVEEAFAETAPAGPTEAELDQVVINDWSNLPTSEIRSKCRNANYKSRFDRLMNEGRLGR